MVTLGASMAASEKYGQPLWSRVVRHLSVHDDSAELASGLRAGVGQASMEETAGCATEA